MVATLTGIALLLASAAAAYPRQERPEDVIWYPIDDYTNGYESTLGEVFVTRQPNNFIGGKYVEYPRNYRSVKQGDWPGSFWQNDVVPERVARPADPIVFPQEDGVGDDYNDDVDIAAECERNCPQTPQYNVICGSDLRNYNNMAALRCAQACGRSVTFAHYGVCGRGLPGIFRPSPKPPRLVSRNW